MKDIAIYGAGGFGREVFAYLRNINSKSHKWNIIGFFDDGKEKGSHNEYGEILGGIDELNNWKAPIDILVTIGAPATLKAVVEKIVNPLVSFPNLIDESTYMADSDSVRFGKGNIVMGGCIFTVNIQLGDFNILNGDVLFGHDAKAGDCNVFMAGTRICGEVEIGNCNLFGMKK